MGFRVHREAVKFAGGEFLVRGLSLNDVAALVRKHRPAISALFTEFQSGENLERAAERMLEVAPGAVADLVGLAADAGPDDEFDKLPAGVAIMAVETVGRLTFEGEGGLKKVLEILASAAEGVSGSLPISMSGSSVSEGTLHS